VYYGGFALLGEIEQKKEAGNEEERVKQRKKTPSIHDVTVAEREQSP